MKLVPKAAVFIRYFVSFNSGYLINNSSFSIPSNNVKESISFSWLKISSSFITNLSILFKTDLTNFLLFNFNKNKKLWPFNLSLFFVK